LAVLPPDTAFVLATPPALHFEQSRLVIDAGRDLIVEKPAFVTEKQVRQIARQCKNAGTVIVEGFMHRHSALFGRFTDFWETHIGSVEALKADFIIPGAPPGTFREGSDIASAGLYDIGCYVVSLLADLRLPLAALSLRRVESPGMADREIVELSGILAGIRVSARIGMGRVYENRVELHTTEGAVTRFSPFFFGRAAERSIERELEGGFDRQTFTEGDAFQAMFAVPRSTWAESQAERLERMIAVATCLESMGRSLLASREGR
jgi:predicted dehydrogenase